MRTAFMLGSIFIFLVGCGGGTRRSDRKKGTAVVSRAKSQKGVSYKFGGQSPKKGFDCSGLAWWSFRKEGIQIPRTTATQYGRGKKISSKSLLPGDLVFFKTIKRTVSHVGIYTGNGNFIHSPRTGKGVRTSALSNKYWKKRYLGARRFW
ncbi:MAG: peptidase P60 [Elusimicrobia bacterium]|nr:MAG: peptidase P60 [Elusimicrobiota bacterium]